MCVIYITHMHLSLYPDIYLYLYPYLKLDLYHTHTHTHTHYIYMYQERDPDNLVFNRAEEWRATLEEKELLSKAQPVEQRQVRITHTHIMYIYIYIYTVTHTHIMYIYIYICTHTHTHKHTRTHTQGSNLWQMSLRDAWTRYIAVGGLFSGLEMPYIDRPELRPDSIYTIRCVLGTAAALECPQNKKSPPPQKGPKKKEGGGHLSVCGAGGRWATCE